MLLLEKSKLKENIGEDKYKFLLNILSVRVLIRVLVY